MSSNNLNAPRLTGGQANPETTSNDADGALDAAITETYTIDLTNSATITAANYRAGIRILVTPSGVAKTLTLQAIKRFVLLDNQGANDITVALGSSSFTLAHGTQCFVYTDGTVNGLLQVQVGGGAVVETALPHDVAMYIAGKPNAAAVVFRMNVVRVFTWPISLTGSVFNARVAATASATFTIKQNGSSIGTLVFGIGGTVPVVTFSAAVTFAVNDLIEIVAPTLQDATLADIAFDFQGSKPFTTTLTPFDLGFFIPGKPATAAVVFRFNAVRQFVWKSGLTGSLVTAHTAATASTVFTIKQNGASIGTATFAIGGTTATLAFAADVFFAVNDLVEVVAPTQDATLADIAFNILGAR